MNGFKDRFSLQGRNAVVTGGAGILGRHFCAGLAESGANVAVVDIRGEEAGKLAAELAARHKVKAIGVACDVTSPESVAGMMKKVVAEFGALHVLHNNAGGIAGEPADYFAPFEAYSLEEWRKVMAVNVDGMFLVAQAAGRQMAAQGGGSIVQTASIYGAMAPDPRIYEGSQYHGRPINTPAAYSAAKAAVIGLTRHLAAYWAPQRIRVNCISPGGADSGQNDEFRERYAARVPLGRMARPDEMVNTLLYLASDASSYVTGQNILVDGGLGIW